MRPGLKILEVGAAKTWASQHLLPRGAEYFATDVLDDDKIGIGRGAFFAERVGHYERVQADGEHLPFAPARSTSPSASRRSTTRSTSRKMVAEMSRVTKRGGAVVALNEGTRPLGWSDEAPAQEGEKALGINEHTHTVWAYLAAFAQPGSSSRELYPAGGRCSGTGNWGIAQHAPRPYSFLGRRRRATTGSAWPVRSFVELPPERCTLAYVIPWIIMAVVAVPLVVIAFMAMRRKTAAGELPASDDAKAEMEREFAAAEAYEDEWREQDKEKFHKERLP